MITRHSRLFLAALLISFTSAMLARADEAVGEKILTPNQQRHIVKVNEDLPGDMKDQPRDSQKMAELRGRLRENVSAYQAAVKQFGNGTPESRAAAHQVLETQEALHKQSVQEEAIPAVSQLPR